MNSCQPRTGRNGVTYAEVADALRTEIVSGKLRPGSRLMTRTAMQARFETTCMTVQRAAQRLIEEGFVRTAGRGGTIVVDAPPHLAHFAFVFPFRLGYDAGVPSQFYVALAAEIRALGGDGRRRIDIFEGVEAHADNQDYMRLVEEVKSHRRAGIIFGRAPNDYSGSPLIDAPGIPRVSIQTPAPDWPQVKCIYPDYRSFLQRALEGVAAEGRRRVAWVSYAPTIDAGHFASACADRGLATRPYWFVRPQIDADSTRRCAHLLMAARGEEQPDAVIVADDNLVPAVTQGIADACGERSRTAGARAPEDLTVVAETNFPYPLPAAVPVRRLGYDIRALVRRCVQMVEQQRQGRRVPRMTWMPAMWEEELGECGGGEK